MFRIGSVIAISTIVCVVLVCALTTTAQVIISKNFVDVIDAATQKYVHSKEWLDFMSDMGFIFPGDETCKDSLPFPSSFNFTRDLILCDDLTAAEIERSKMYKLAAKLLTQTIREQYPTTHSTLNYTMVSYDVSQLGLFETMRNLVNNGKCDVVITAINWDGDRKSKVHFQCPYGASTPGFVRSEKDNTTLILNNEKEIDQSGVNVAVVVKSVYEEWAISNLKVANLVSYPTWDVAWESILNKTSHVLLYNANALIVRLKLSKSNCETCTVKFYGDVSPFSSFISNQFSASPHLSLNIFVWIISTCLLFLFSL